jgi:hypothetical protein
MKPCRAAVYALRPWEEGRQRDGKQARDLAVLERRTEGEWTQGTEATTPQETPAHKHQKTQPHLRGATLPSTLTLLLPHQCHSHTTHDGP